MKRVKQFAFALLIAMLAVLAAATVVEKLHGTAAARAAVYDAPWFVAMWAAIAVAGLVYIVSRRLHRQPATLLLHVALLVILAGAGITWQTAQRGRVQVAQGKPLREFYGSQGQAWQLPFTVTLQSFDIQTYPGTHAPMDYVSHIVVTDPADGTTNTAGTVSMNKVFTHRGYRFYQTGYDAGGGGSVFTISHDPAGIAVTYCGYALLLIAMLWTLVSRKSGFRRLLRHRALRRTAAVAMLLLATTTASATPPTVPRDVADQMATLRILHNGRICPFQTFAREFTAKLCGKTAYQGLTAEQVVAGWIFYYDNWKDEPMIKVKNGTVRHILGIEQGKYASLQDFNRAVSDGSMPLAIDSLQAAGDDATMRAIAQADEQYQVASIVAAGTAVKLFPLNHNGSLEWYSQGSLEIPHDIDDGKWAFVRHGMDYLYELVVKQDWQGAQQFIDKLRQYQEKEGGALLPSATRFGAEMWYNRLSHDRLVAILLVTAGIILFIVVCRAGADLSRLPRWVLTAGRAALVLACLYLTVVIALRWVVSGHVPLSNGFETMQGMAWAALVTALALQRRWGLVMPFGLLTAGLALMVASLSESNPQITPLMPVLASPPAQCACGCHHAGICAAGVPDAIGHHGSCAAPKWHIGGAAASGGATHPVPCRVLAGSRHLYRCRVGKRVVGHLLELGPQGGVGTHHPHYLCPAATHPIVAPF